MLGTPNPVLAHAVHGPGIPLPLLVLASGLAVAGVAAFVDRRKPVADGGGVPLPAALTRPVGVAPVGRVLRVAGVALGVWLLVRPLSGLWPLLAVASLLLGPVWRLVNPLRVVADGLAAVSGDAAEDTVRPLPEGVGWWPAAAALLVIGWVTLALFGRPLAGVVLVGAVVVAVLARVAVYGRGWLDHGDPFEVYSAALGALAPLERDPTGRLALVSPRRRLAQLPPVPGTAALAGALIGWDLGDAIVETEAWHVLVFPAGAITYARTGLLLACALVVGTLAARATSRHGLSTALLPVIAGWALGHHVAPLSPLLGLVGFVAGHLAAVVVAHDRADGPAAQLELRTLVVLLLPAGLALRFGGL